ncbi:surfeit locus protein 6 homolog [Ischnura elegans]|uniref:surfeit locus protein 6 homolog n=1 Tax=Ischnura elegans TaxID=197161 RepID=UPI001ED88735|nr:surfeit locus protein 6 homolog [Ischnura elegans]
MISRTEMIPIDFKAVQEKLKEDNKFLWELLKILPNVKSPDEAEEESPYLRTYNKNNNRKPSLGKEGTDRAKSLEELHARLSELKGKKLDYKEKLMKKKLKNQMKKKKRSKELGMKRTLIKLPKSEKEEILGMANGSAAGLKPSKPVFNSAGKMVFSKFDFRSDELVGDGVAKGKKNKKEDPKKLMERLKREKKEEEDGGDLENEEGGEMDKKKMKSWASVLARSRGEKVLDDPELLKKSINRAESKKRSSQKKWKEREEKVTKEKEERQAKRTAAISAKKKEKKMKKIKKAVKKGRIIPGFS